MYKTVWEGLDNQQLENRYFAESTSLSFCIHGKNTLFANPIGLIFASTPVEL